MSRLHSSHFIWTPVPEPNFQPPKNSLTVILKNEPMRGGGSHFHYAEQLYRQGGKTVFVFGASILTQSQFNRLDRKDRVYYRQMTEDPLVYVKGKVSHEEHATLHLGDTWHKVLVNTESKARAARNVRFLD